MAQLTQLLPEALESPDHALVFIDCMVPFEVGMFVPFRVSLPRARYFLLVFCVVKR